MKIIIALTIIVAINKLTYCDSIIFKDSNNIAINGFDVVSYHIDSSAVKGNDSIFHIHANAKWLFINEKNRNDFIESPEKFIPQFGGYCSYGMKFGGLYPTDPKAFTLYNEKLYLNFSEKINSRWNNRREHNIKKANRKWIKKQ